MFAVTAAEFTAEDTAKILVNCFVPLWGCPSTLLPDNGLQFCAQLATAVYKLMGIHKLTTSAYHLSGNGGVERVNHTMAQMLAMVCNEHQNDWDAHLPHVEYAYNNYVSAAAGLAPNEVYTGRLPRLPLIVFDRSYGGAHQSLDRNHLAYSPENDNNTPTSLCVNNTLLQFLGNGYTTPPPPYDKDCAKASTAKFSKKTLPQLDRPLQNRHCWPLPSD